MSKLLLFYLTNNDRFFVFEKFMKELLKCRYKDVIDLLIVSSESNLDMYQDYTHDIYNNATCVHVPCPKSDYLPKVRYAIEYAKVLVKVDGNIVQINPFNEYPKIPDVV